MFFFGQSERKFKIGIFWLSFKSRNENKISDNFDGKNFKLKKKIQVNFA